MLEMTQLMHHDIIQQGKRKFHSILYIDDDGIGPGTTAPTFAEFPEFQVRRNKAGDTAPMTHLWLDFFCGFLTVKSVESVHNCLLGMRAGRKKTLKNCVSRLTPYLPLIFPDLNGWQDGLRDFQEAAEGTGLSHKFVFLPGGGDSFDFWKNDSGRKILAS